MDPLTIFRKEALEHQCVRLAGTVSLKADRGTSRAAFGYMAIAVLAIAGFARMEVTSSTPISCRVTGARQALIGPTALYTGAGTRLERVEIEAGGRVVAVIPQAGTADRHGGAAVPLGPGAAAGQCRATARLVLRPMELIAAKLAKHP